MRMTIMMRVYTGFFLCQCLLHNHPTVVTTAQQARGIPGATQTLSGYDTELGTDAVCWNSYSARKYDGEVYPFPNELVKDFSVAGNITLQKQCPVGNTITAALPDDREALRGRGMYFQNRLRTSVVYNYTVHATFNLTSLQHPYFVSDTGPTVLFQILLCINGVSGFCSPFIHEEANERIVRNGGELTTVARGDRHGGTHVHSFLEVHLPPNDGPVYNVTVDIPVLVNTEGDFYAIAAVQFFVGDDPTDVNVRWDMANAMPIGQRLVSYQDPAQILDVPRSILWLCNGMRAVAAAVIAFLLAHTLYYRNHQVLKLSQQPFLVAMLVACLAATVGSLLLEPRNDFYCRWGKLVVLSSLHLALAVTAGRMWRINRVISPLLAQTLRSKESVWNQWFRRCSSQFSTQRSVDFRREITPWHLTGVIALLTAPQLICQLIAAIWQEKSLEIDFNYDESVGRQQCQASGVGPKNDLAYYGFYIFVLLILILSMMSYLTHHLPSLFNETEVIFNTAISSLIVLSLGVAVVIITDGPTTSPSIEYLTWCVAVFCITLNVSCRVMLPKLRMVWRGETVLVSKLVAEHSRHVREDNDAYMNSMRISGLNGTADQTDNSNTDAGDYSRKWGKFSRRRFSHKESDSQDLAIQLEEFERPSFSERPTSLTEVAPSVAQENSSEEGRAEAENEDALEDSIRSGNLDPSVDMRRVAFQLHRGDELKQSSKMTISHHSHHHVPEPTLISENETPPKTLILKMYHMQAHLAEVNQRIMSGMAVSKSDWEKLRRLSTRMGATFEQVSFDWNREESNDSFSIPRAGRRSREISPRSSMRSSRVVTGSNGSPTKRSPPNNTARPPATTEQTETEVVESASSPEVAPRDVPDTAPTPREATPPSSPANASDEESGLLSGKDAAEDSFYFS